MTGFASDVADRERNQAGQFALYIEAPLPNISLLPIRLKPPNAYRRRRGLTAIERIVERQNRLACTEAAGGRSRDRIGDRVELLEPGEWWHQVRRADLHEMLRTGVLACAHADHPFRTRTI